VLGLSQQDEGSQGSTPVVFAQGDAPFFLLALPLQVLFHHRLLPLLDWLLPATASFDSWLFPALLVGSDVGVHDLSVLLCELAGGQAQQLSGFGEPAQLQIHPHHRPIDLFFVLFAPGRLLQQ
jgi:hypothetical protein